MVIVEPTAVEPSSFEMVPSPAEKYIIQLPEYFSLPSFEFELTSVVFLLFLLFVVGRAEQQEILILAPHSLSKELCFPRLLAW